MVANKNFMLTVCVCVCDSYVRGTDVESDSLAPGRYTLNWVPEGKTYNFAN